MDQFLKTRCGSVLLVSISLVVFLSFLLTVYIRSMSKYRNAAISDVFNTHAEIAMRNGQIKVMHTLQRAALVDDPDDPDFYSTFQSSWRTEFRRDKTLEPGGEWPDANATMGSATWQLPEKNVPNRSEDYRTYGPVEGAYNWSDRLSDGMLQILGLKTDTKTSKSIKMTDTLGSNAGARWHEIGWLDNEGQPSTEADGRYIVRYAVELLDLSGFMGFNFYPEESVDFSSMSNAEALALRRKFRALRERYGSALATVYAKEGMWRFNRYTYNILSRANQNMWSVDPYARNYRHHLEPFRIEDDPFKVEVNWLQQVNAPQSHTDPISVEYDYRVQNLSGVNLRFDTWKLNTCHAYQTHDLFQGHGHLWSGDGNAITFKAQVIPGPYYSYQAFASTFLGFYDNLDGMFYMPHSYNLFDTGLLVANGDDCDAPFRVNLLTATNKTLENMIKGSMCRLKYIRPQDWTGQDAFDGPGTQLFPFAIGDPLMPFSSDPAAADMYDDNLDFNQHVTFANTANAPVNSTLDAWYERTGSMYQWFYGLDYNEGRQLGPRSHIENSFLSGYQNHGPGLPYDVRTAQRFTRRNTFDLNVANTYEHDVMEALMAAVYTAKRAWNGKSHTKLRSSDPAWADNTQDPTLEELKQEWDDFAWLRTGSATSSVSDIEDESKHELATVHDVEQLFLRILGEQINTNAGNARGGGQPYDRQDPKTWRALPRTLSGRFVEYQNSGAVQDDRIKTDHVLPVPQSNQRFSYDTGSAENARIRTHQNTAGMERLLNDVRMSFFGSPAIDFNFDAFAESSTNGWNDGGDSLVTWMTNAATRGGQKNPSNDRYGPGYRNGSGTKTPLTSGNATFTKLRTAHVDWMELDEGQDSSRDYGFTVTGRFYMGKSQAYRCFIRGQVWDTVRNKKTSEVMLDMSYAPNPSDDPTTYAIEDTDLSDSHVIMQRPIRNYQLFYSEDNFTE